MSFEGYKEYLAIADWYLPTERKSRLSRKPTTPLKPQRCCRSLRKRDCQTGQAAARICTKTAKAKLYLPFPPPERTRRGRATPSWPASSTGFARELPDVAIMCGNIAGSNCVTAYGCLTAKITEKDMLERLKSFTALLWAEFGLNSAFLLFSFFSVKFCFY